MTVPHRHRLVPRVERLEERNLLDCSATFANGVITIVGTSTNNSVLINDGGNEDGAFVQVVCDGNQKLLVSGSSVRSIQFSMGAGNDRVSYILFGDLARGAGGTRTINGDLGGGNDSFSATLTGALSSAAVKINVRGGLGIDSMNSTILESLILSASLSITLNGGQSQDFITCTSTAHVGTGCSLAMNMLGMQGNDKLTMNSFGDMDGRLNALFDGGFGNDIIISHMQMSQGSGMTNTGPVTSGCQPVCQMCGGQGNDQMSMSFQSSSQFQASFQSLSS